MKPHQANTLTLVCLVLLAGTPALAERTVAYPNAIDVTLQAMDRAGCGGTVKLAPGTYSERAQFPNSNQATVSSSCRGLRVIGAGVDRTFIDGMGLSDPVGTPVIAFGYPPFAVFLLTGPYELAHLTIYTDDPLGTTLHGFGTGWTRDTSVHHIRIAGFLRGILMSLTNDTSISHATVQCPGVDPADFGRFTRGIAFSTSAQLRHQDLTRELDADIAIDAATWERAGAAAAAFACRPGTPVRGRSAPADVYLLSVTDRGRASPLLP